MKTDATQGESADQPSAAVAFPCWHLDGPTLGILLGGLFAFYWAIQWRHFGYSVDGAIYLAGARSLAEGNGYRFVAHSGTPPIGLYPPLQSLYLSMWWRMQPGFPANVTLLNFGMILQALLCSGLGYALLRQLRVPPSLASLLVACWCTSTYWCQWMFWMFSDFGFTALCLGAALFALRSGPWPATARWLVLGSLLATAYLWRTAAIGVLVALGILVVRQRQRLGWAPIVAFIAPALVAIVTWRCLQAGAASYGYFWNLRLAELGGWPGYWHQVAGNVAYVLKGRTFWEAFADIIPSIQLRILAPHTSTGARALGLAMGLAFWLGVFLMVRPVLSMPRSWRAPFALVTSIYVLEILLFPDAAIHFHRYLYVAVPFFLAFAYQGWQRYWVAHLRIRRAVGGVAVAGLTVLCLANSSFTARFLGKLEATSRLDELHEVADWVRDHTPTNAVVAVSHHLPTQHLYAWSGRKLASDYFSDEPVSSNPVTRAAQRQVRADYRLIGTTRPTSGRPVEDAWDRSLLPVITSAHGAYRLFAVTAAAEDLSRSNILRFDNAAAERLQPLIAE